MALVLKDFMHRDHLEGMVRHTALGPTPRVSGSKRYMVGPWPYAFLTSFQRLKTLRIVGLCNLNSTKERKITWNQSKSLFHARVNACLEDRGQWGHSHLPSKKKKTIFQLLRKVKQHKFFNSLERNINKITFFKCLFLLPFNWVFTKKTYHWVSH